MPARSSNLAASYTETTDAASSIATAYSISVGDSFTGTLGVVGDTDWVGITLTAGQTYTIDLTGSGASPVSDTYLRLRDSGGSVVAFNDDGGSGLNASLTFTATSTGTYFLEADSFANNKLGTYTLAVDEALPLPTYTNDQIADQLTDGFWDWFGGQSRRAFDVAPGGSLDVNITALTADGQTLATAALQAWTFVTGISFNFVSTAADINFDDDQSGAFSSSSVTGSTITSSNVNVSTAWLASSGTTLDSYSFQTYIHEIGHAMGLGHGGNYNGSASYGTDNQYTNDSWQASVMSYFSQTENTSIDASYAFNITPMIADILAMQVLYGAATNQRVGNTTYGENSTAGGYYDQITGLGNAITFTIFDNGGTDMLDFRSATSDQVIDLRPETVSSVYGLTGNMSITRGTVLENVISGSGDDIISGNSAANRIWGKGGKDSLSGGGDKDRLFGGGQADKLWGGNGNDRLSGGGGKDRLEGGGGNDKLTGGSRVDTFVFRGDSTGADKITDFTDDMDTLRLDDALWGGGLTVSQVISTYATVVNGGADVLFDFGSGNRITLQGFGATGTAALLDDIALF
jgi:serralysin